MNRTTRTGSLEGASRRTGRAVALAAAAGIALLATPALAGASPHATSGAAARPAAGSARPAALSSFCSKVSAATVSATVGWKVPAPTESTTRVPASKKDGGVTSTDMACAYGAYTDLSHIVLLDVGTTSKPITAAVLQKVLAAAEAQEHVKLTFKPYSGLGMPAWWITFKIETEEVQEVVGVQGTHYYGGAVFANVPESKVGALAKLATQL